MVSSATHKSDFGKRSRKVFLKTITNRRNDNCAETSSAETEINGVSRPETLPRFVSGPLKDLFDPGTSGFRQAGVIHREFRTVPVPHRPTNRQ